MNRTTSRILKTGLLGVGLLLNAAAAVAQTGQTSMPFLRIEPNSRASSLGNTGVAMADGDHAAFWNPAWLGSITQTNISLSRYDWMPELGLPFVYHHLSVSNPINDRSGFSAHLTYFDLGQQMATDAAGNNLGLFGNYELSTGLAYGRRMSDHWSLGGGLKYLRSSVATGQFSGGERIDAAQGVAVDVAAAYRTGFRSYRRFDGEFRAGMNLSNMGPGVKYMDSQPAHDIPSNLRFGWAFEAKSKETPGHRVILSNDITRLMNTTESLPQADLGFIERLTFGTGAEYWYNDLVALRAGYYTESRANGNREYVTLGTGIRYQQFGIDLGYLMSTQAYHPLDNTLRITVKLNLAKPKPVVIPAPVPVKCDCPIVVPVAPAPAPVEVAPAPAPAVVIPAIPDLSNAIVRFDVMKSDIKDEYRADIQRVYDAMNADNTLRVRIAGHADTTGDGVKNRLLGESRSRAVMLELIAMGIDPRRFDIEGFADVVPVAENSTVDGRRLNRRTEFTAFRGVDRSFIALPVATKRAEIGVPVKKGAQIRFHVLEWKDQSESGEWIVSVNEALASDSTLTVVIGTRIRNRGGMMPNYFRELEKARSEKVKAQMVLSGMDASRIRVVKPDETLWNTHLKSHETRDTHQTIVIVVRD
jgi:outer membrane protein OmpA-like peptidoglycan-associated protein